MNEILCAGQRLKTLTDEYVTIVKIEDGDMIVEYKDKLYKRSVNIVGSKLFVCEDDDDLPWLVTESSENTLENELIRTCKDCMLYRREDCFGEKSICDQFVNAPNISKAEMKQWPAYGDATAFRLKNGPNR